EALSELELLVVQDIFLNDTAELANVVFPAASYAEKDGTYTATDRRVQLVRKAIKPVGEAKADWEIISLLAKRMEIGGFEFDGPEDIWREVRSVTPTYAGITYERLEAQSVQWPCRMENDRGTEFMHEDAFVKGLGTFTPVDWRPPAEIVDEEFPFYLTTGRVHFHYHTGTMTRRSPSLNREMSSGTVDINPYDAIRLRIAGGELVKVASRRGEVKIRARITEMVPAGVVFIPFNFKESAANALTNPARDPITKIPEFKVCAVRIEKAASR
ncbi:MAG: molybdopterin oxidoreductase family protein, partial [Candidatus Geothermincolia bacterium]